MSMREYTVREFVNIMTSQGWVHDHHNSNHYVYKKEGFPNKLTINHHERTVRPVIAKRLIKEGNLII